MKDDLFMIENSSEEQKKQERKSKVYACTLRERIDFYFFYIFIFLITDRETSSILTEDH